jgi:hypothetical protein
MALPLKKPRNVIPLTHDDPAPPAAPTPEPENPLLNDPTLQALLSPNTQHIFHHSGSDVPKVNVKVERNSRGYNWEASVAGAESVEDAISLLATAEERLRLHFGTGMVPESTEPKPAPKAEPPAIDPPPATPASKDELPF